MPVSGNGTFNPTEKKRLIDACVQTATSLSALDSTAGANANQSHKWVSLHEWANTAAQEAT
jgi:transposase